MFPFIGGIARYGGVRCTIPAARPFAFNRAALVARIASAPWLCIFIGGGIFRYRVAGEPHHVIIVGVWNVHDAERISGCRIVFGYDVSPALSDFIGVSNCDGRALLRNGAACFVNVGIAGWRRGGHPISGGTLLATSDASGAR